MPVHPGTADARAEFFYWFSFGAAVITFLALKRLYQTRFGLAINAIRDDEDKAEALGVHTLRHKIVAWSVSAFFLGISGAIFGNMTGFIEPLEVAFPTVTFGIFMVAMPLLGGKGTLWGPVMGAIVFHLVKEVTWTYLLGWQWVALGMIIIITVVFFQQGIMGWMKEKWPEKFGVVIDQTATEARNKGAAE
jgi:branched-chain amino acid transport system permease protein